jgi:FkbM family methyltransferase
MNKSLIIDVGMHIGRDTEFYLKKGFNVIAIEANPILVNQAYSLFKEEILNNRLIIFDIAIAEYDGEIDFYVNNTHDDWGTTSKEFAMRNERFSTVNSLIKVKCTPFQKILKQIEMPYYIKIDIEGADILCLKALMEFEERPKYISIEAGLTSFEETFSELSLLWNLGYRKFKIVNQAINAGIQCINPSLEGNFVDYQFDGTCSGPFGEEAPGKWMSIEETFIKYRRLLVEQKYFGADGKLYNTFLHKIYEKLKREPAGWYDFHAKQ